MSDGNTEGTPIKVGDAVETTRQHLLQTVKAYLLGAIHDATERKLTFRISQKYKNYPIFIKKLLAKVGKKAWIYKEGKNDFQLDLTYYHDVIETNYVFAIWEKKTSP